MLERFVDTSGWATWADRNQLFHTQAVAAFEEVWDQGGLLATTNAVLAELTALLTRPMRITKAKQISLLRDIRTDPSVEIVFLDAVLEGAVWQFWEARPDKEWTFVDGAPVSSSCSSAGCPRR